MKETVSELVEDVNQTSAIANNLHQIIKELFEKEGSTDLLKILSLCHCKLRVQLFERIIFKMNELKNEIPEMQNNAEFILLNGKWCAEFEKAKEELSNYI